MLKATLVGMGVTLRQMFKKPVTIEYPDQKPNIPFNYRGKIILTVDPSGEERCVACYLCSSACPVDCITISAAEKDNGRRYPEAFRINFNRCIFCGLCAEACPTLALQMSTDFEMATRVHEGVPEGMLLVPRDVEWSASALQGAPVKVAALAMA